MADAPPEQPSDDLSHAIEQLDALRAVASEADSISDELHSTATIHEVQGMGRYALPYAFGWVPLLSAIQHPALGLGFSQPHYPLLDGVIAETFGHHALVQETHVLYPQLPYSGLRDNLAALRNFLLETYYRNTPEGMTTEKAGQALREIARYVGDGLHFNPMPGGLVPKRGPYQPFIDMQEAAKPDGAGAQYLYEKVLEMDRQSGWIRPFSAIVAMFGGHVVDWHLPPASSTPFRTLYDTPRAPEEMTLDELDGALAALDDYEERQRNLEEQDTILGTATDLDAMGTQLMHMAQSLQDVAQMSEPVRQDAIAIAREILRKLKISIGVANVLDGLGIRPNDNLSDLGGIRAVALVYERLLGWGRGVDATIMQHPSIVAATQAIGQLGALAKKEALRVAMLAGNKAMSQRLSAQVQQIPPTFNQPAAKQVGELLEKVEHGIDTVLNRVVTISGPGAMVGHSRSNELGSFMNSTPIAGMALQTNADGVNRAATQRQQQSAQEAQQTSQRAQVQRAIQQVNNQQQQNRNTQQQNTNNRTQLNALRQRLNQARRNAQQNLQTTLRNSSNRNALQSQQHHDHHDHHDHHPPVPANMAATLAKMDARLVNSIKQMNNTTAGLTNAPLVTGRAAYNKFQQANTGGVKGGKPLTEEEKKKQELQAVTPPPPKKDHGRGF